MDPQLTLVPALPWKMGTPSSFWELKMTLFPRIFSAILSPLCMKTRRNQSLNLSLFPQNNDIFRNFTPILHENKEKSGLKFTPFFKDLDKTPYLMISQWLLTKYPPFSTVSRAVKSVKCPRKYPVSLWNSERRCIFADILSGCTGQLKESIVPSIILELFYSVSDYTLGNL